VEFEKMIFVTPSLSGGGIEVSTPLLIQELMVLKRCPILWIGINESKFDGHLPGVEIQSLPRKSRSGWKETLLTLLTLRSIIRSCAKPLVILNGEMAELLTIILPKNIPIVCVEHASRPWQMNPRLGKVVRHRLAKMAKAWATVNSNQKLIWPNIDEFVYIPNPIQFTSVKSDDQGVGAIHIGRVTSEKGLEVVCQALESLPVDLDVYGEGDLLPILRKKYLHHSRFHFHGFIGNVWSGIGGNRLLISASSHEGDGRNIAEAILRRQPILLLDTTDHRRFSLPEENYFRDIDSLVRAIQTNLEDSFTRLRPSEALARSEAEKRNPQTVAKAWSLLISSI
jgi:glycosyltransferase involved in cell wall biosynthesis